MSAWTKMAYGTFIATAFAGAVSTAVYYSWDRSMVKAIDIAVLTEARMEHQAALGPWPFTTNAPDVYGWDTGYATNIDGTAYTWNFNDLWYGIQYMPIFGSINPRRAMQINLDLIQHMVPDYVDHVGTNGAPVYMTVTGLWARLGIGDHTNKWTIACTTNGIPIYSNNVGSILSTVTLAEAWAVLGVMTSTYVSVDDFTGWTSNRNCSITNGVYSWMLSTQNVDHANTFPNNYDPDSTRDPNWFPPASVLGFSLLEYDLCFYDLEEADTLGDWIANESSCGESWLFNTFFKAGDNLEVRRKDENFVTRDEVTWLRSYDEDWNLTDLKMRRKKNYICWQLDIPAFPSGVVASVYTIYNVKTDWSAGELKWDPEDYTDTWGVHTNYHINTMITQAIDSISFTGTLGTGIVDRFECIISPCLTNFLPDTFWEYTIPHFIQQPDDWAPAPVEVVEWWNDYQYGVVGYGPTIANDYPRIDGSCFQTGGGPYFYVNWKFRYRQEVVP